MFSQIIPDRLSIFCNFNSFKMENFDLNALGVHEIEKINLMKVNGGQISPNPWWSLASTIIQATVIVLKAGFDAYTEYSAKTGGKYVIHHAV